jgi:hypothetical protein
MRKDTGVYPGNGVVGRERPQWYSVGKLPIISGRISVADLGAIPGPDAVCVRVPIGDHLVEARLIDFNGSLCLSRVRARDAGAKPSFGPQIGQVSVDFGAVAIADLDAIRATLTDDDEDDLAELTGEMMGRFGEIVHLKFGCRSVRFAVCQSGFGDGTFPVFALKAGRRVIGIEVEFICDGHILRKR